MTVFTYDFSDYDNYCKELAALLKIPYENNTVHFPEYVASGQAKLLSFPNGLQAVIQDCVLHDDFTWQRIASFPEIFILRVDYVEINTDMEVKLDDEVFRDESKIYSSITLTSSRFGLDATVKKGSVVKSANIIIKPEWLKKYLPADAVNYWLHALRSLKLKGVNMVPMDFNTRQSLFGIIDMSADDPAYKLKALTRIFEITDYYFKKVNCQFGQWNKQQKSFTDIDKIIELDVFLTRDFNQPVLTLDEMAVSVHMSPSKLKSLFKKTYGQSIYEYFTVSRLNKARHLLLENNLSIKEVAWQMGYSAVSNFSAAFKKQFHISPGEMLATPY